MGISGKEQNDLECLRRWFLVKLLVAERPTTNQISMWTNLIIYALFVVIRYLLTIFVHRIWINSWLTSLFVHRTAYGEELWLLSGWSYVMADIDWFIVEDRIRMKRTMLLCQLNALNHWFCATCYPLGMSQPNCDIISSFYHVFILATVSVCISMLIVLTNRQKNLKSTPVIEPGSTPTNYELDLPSDGSVARTSTPKACLRFTEDELVRHYTAPAA